MSDERQATPERLLREYIMNPNTAKNEHEWWAHHEINRQQAEIERLRGEIAMTHTQLEYAVIALNKERRLKGPLVSAAEAALHYMRLHQYADQAWADDLEQALAAVEQGEAQG